MQHIFSSLKRYLEIIKKKSQHHWDIGYGVFNDHNLEEFLEDMKQMGTDGGQNESVQNSF